MKRLTLVFGLALLFGGSLHAQSSLTEAAAKADAARIAAGRAAGPTLPTYTDSDVATGNPSVVGSSAPASPLSTAGIATMIRTQCATEWPTDYRMRVFCETQQRAAVATFSIRTAVMTSSPTLQGIRTQCLRDWSTRTATQIVTINFRMWNFCEEQQVKALASLR